MKGPRKVDRVGEDRRELREDPWEPLWTIGGIFIALAIILAVALAFLGALTQ